MKVPSRGCMTKAGRIPCLLPGWEIASGSGVLWMRRQTENKPDEEGCLPYRN